MRKRTRNTVGEFDSEELADISVQNDRELLETVALNLEIALDRVERTDRRVEEADRRLSANLTSLQAALQNHGYQLAAHTQELAALRRDNARHSDEFHRIREEDKTGAIQLERVSQTWRTVKIVGAIVAFIVATFFSAWSLWHAKGL